MISHLFTTIADWYMANINYLTITLLMAIESSFIPLPSELVIPPAAWKAAQGDLNIWLVILFGTLGALLGSLFNYFLALIIGRKIIYALADTKVAHLMHIYPHTVERAEEYFRRRGNISIFIGRLVPAVRHLISIPAGLAKMKLRDFIIYTATGAGIWNICLAALGYFLYTQKEVLEKYYRELSIVFLILGVLVFAWFTYKAIVYKKNKSK
jgi:membrane protein DedA with SNARE-associated domain